MASVSFLTSKFRSMLDVALQGLGKYYTACAICLGDSEKEWKDYLGCGHGAFFDVASLTKPLVGSNLILKLELLDDRIADFLPDPEFDSDRKAKIRVSDVLNHKGGFVAHYPLFQKVGDMEPSPQTRQIIMDEAWRIPLQNEHEVLYSDIGFISLTYYLEKRSGKTVDELLYENFGFTGLFFLKDVPENSEVVPTSYTRRVHDENAHYMLSVSLHAGLFCNLEGISSAIRYIMYNYADLFLEEGVDKVKNGERFSLGFDSFVHNEKVVFGHLGFTGCGFWIDFHRRTYAVFLSNRVFPSVGRYPVQAPEGFINIRRRIWHILCE